MFKRFPILGCAAIAALSLWLMAPSPNTAQSTQHFKSYAVASDQQRASEVGASILEAGGTAADAAAATMAALGVINPASSGLGGGGFLLYYRASDKSLHFHDFRERAPDAATATLYDGVKDPAEGPASKASQLYGLSSGVPGEPAGIAKMVEDFGKLPLSQVLEPAARLADQAVISDYSADSSRHFGVHMLKDPVMKRWFKKGQKFIARGQIIRQKELAKTIRALGRQGKKAIYRGTIAKQIVSRNRAMGGIFTMKDLADYKVVTRKPLEGTYFGHRWVTAPPPSAGGYTMLASLAVLDSLPQRWKSTQKGVNDPAWLHAVAESWKGPYLDRQRYFGDPDHVELPMDKLMDPKRIQQRRNTFHPALAIDPNAYELPIGPPHAVTPAEDHGTSHLCVVDKEGNVAAVTTTVNLPFGGRYTAAGMVMNDEMDDFARAVGETNAFGLVGGANNLPGPGRRPVSTMSPTIVFDGEGPVLCAGAAGGSRIVTAIQQVAMNNIILKMPLEEALSSSRIHHQSAPNKLRSETFAPLKAETITALESRGHIHEPIHHVAIVQAIQILRGKSKGLVAGSDPRKGGIPAGR